MLKLATNLDRTDHQQPTRESLMARVQALLPAIRERSRWTDENRRLPEESVRELYDLELPRVLVPKARGGMELDIRTWVELAIEIGKADAAHGWCASLMMHHPHYLAMFPKGAQDFVWAEGTNQGIAGTFSPLSKIDKVDGGYQIHYSHARYLSGVNHCKWIFIGGMMTNDDGSPDWRLFLIPPGQFRIDDVWDTVGMRGTGSNDVYVENVFVPDDHTVAMSGIINGNPPGAELNPNSIYRVPLIVYSPLTFLAPMLGAALGALEYFRVWTQTRVNTFGLESAKNTITQFNFAKAEATIDLAQMLIERCIDATEISGAYTDEIRGRCHRDQVRASELLVEGMDQLMNVIGAAGYAKSHPVQQAWRDVRFASSHMILTPELAYVPWGRLRFGLPRDPKQLY